MLSMAWLIPGLIPLLDIFWKKGFSPMLLVLFIAPLCVLVVNYGMITKAIYQQQKRKIRAKVTPQGMVHSSNQISTNVSKDQLRHIKLAKVVSLLITCYVVCMLPFIIWILMNLINKHHHFLGEKNLQNFYIFSAFTASSNSCLNPCIYVWKNLEFRRSLRKLFKKTRVA